MVVGLNKNIVSKVLVFGNFFKLKRGDFVYRTKLILSIPVGLSLLGNIVNSLGNIIRKKKEVSKKKIYLKVERNAPGFIEREPVNISLVTGWKLVDCLFPIGRGQRQLIVGDRKTGKTILCIDTILSQRFSLPPVMCVYVSIGNKKVEVVQIANLLSKYDCLKFSIIVSASSNDPITLQFLAPYAGCTISEYFRDRGRHSLVIYDDLSKHAVAYRQVCLLMRRPPGRDAYPGDVFYLHSRLLERAGRLNILQGRGSLTALPIVETINGDLTTYIVTNLISITDGQLILDVWKVQGGIFPAVNTSLSVSRVGAKAQGKIWSSLSKDVKRILASYLRIADIERYDVTIDESTKILLKRGKNIIKHFLQIKNNPYMIWRNILILTYINHKIYDGISDIWYILFKENLEQFFRFLFIMNFKFFSKKNIFLLDDILLNQILINYILVFKKNLKKDNKKWLFRNRFLINMESFGNKYFVEIFLHKNLFNNKN